MKRRRLNHRVNQIGNRLRLDAKCDTRNGSGSPGWTLVRRRNVKCL